MLINIYVLHQICDKMKTIVILLAFVIAHISALSSDDLVFLENKGQYRSIDGQYAEEVLYYFNSGDFSVYLRANGLSYVYHKTSSKNLSDSGEDLYSITRDSYRIDMNFVGASKDFHFENENIGAFSTWFTPDNEIISREFSSITYKNLYRGIDLKVYFNEDNNIEYDFIVAPYTDPDKIRLEFVAADNLKILPDGSISSLNYISEFKQSKPYSYQENLDNNIESKFYFVSENMLGIKTADYDRTIPLIIDPMTRLWGTLYGGNDYDDALDVAVDGSGNVYFAGVTSSENNSNYIATPGAYQTTYMGGLSTGTGDAILVKFSPSGTRIWSTYYGGTNDEVGYGVDVDGLDYVYLTGFTKSYTGISTVGAYQETFGGNTDAFLVKFSNGGTRIWATYYGGTDNDKAHGIDVMNDGTIFICGRTSSENAIASIDAHQEFPGGGPGSDGFLVKFNTDGGREWGTYYGGSQSDFSYGCEADGAGTVALVGVTFSDDNISSPGAHQVNYAGGGGADAYLALFTPIGNRIWGTYYGGATEGGDMAYGVDFDVNGNIYICGTTSTQTANIIATAGSHQPNFGGGTIPYEYDAFVAKFNNDGERQWGTYYGGEANDFGDKISIDNINNVYLFGSTLSESDIATEDAFKTDNPFGGYFIASLDNNSERNWATYYGCCSSDRRYRGGIAVSDNRVVYIANYAVDDEDFVSDNAHQTVLRGGEDAFFASFGDISLSLSLDKDTYCPGELAEFTVTVASTTNSTLNIGNEFMIEISDVNGDFTTSQLIGVISSTESITFELAITDDIIEGENYRFRVHSTNPKLMSPDNGIDITINSKPVEDILGEVFTCKNEQRVYSVNDLPQYAYEWSVEGGEIIGVNDFNEVLVRWGSENSGRVMVGITNTTTSCSANMVMDVNLIEKPQITINGKDTVCINSESTYFANQLDDVVYSWSVIGGNLITTNDGDRITVEWTELGEATIELTESYPDYDCDTTYSFTVYIFDLPNAEFNSETEVCLWHYSSFEAPLLSDNFEYSWQVENGAVNFEDGGELSVFWNQVGTANIRLKVTDKLTGCFSEFSTDILVNPQPNAKIQGITDVCNGCSESYNVVGEFSNAFDWRVIGGTIISDNGTEIEVEWGSSTVGSIRVFVNNDFGCMDTLTLDIQISNSPRASIVGDESVCLNDIVIYSTSSNPNYVNDWEVINGTILSEPSNHQIEVHWTEIGIAKIKLSQTDSQTQLNQTNEIDIQVNEIPPTPEISLVDNILSSSWQSLSQWYYEGSPIHGATSATYKPNNEGIYQVKAINEWGCESELSDEFFYDIISVPVASHKTVHIYPNPANDYFNVIISGRGQIELISVTDILGNIVFEGNSELTEGRINVEQLGSGVYYIQIRTSVQVYTQKVIVQR